MIALDGVSKTYRTVRGGRHSVLDRVSAEFPGGCNIGILGSNGAGKSTLLRLLAGSESPDRGRIRRNGRVSFPLGYDGTFHGALSGRENVAFLARVYGCDLHRTIDYVCDFAEIGAYFENPVNTYSAGMRARLAFGACLAIDFDIYLIDEVTEIGDDRFRRKCAAAFRDRVLRSDIILATHNSRTIHQYCDRAAVLCDGKLQMFDDVARALERYRRQPEAVQ
jgi:capsular polysaccharide transport system ATP-binding protein